MTAQILEGKPVAAKIREELAPQIAGFRKQYGLAPTLAIVRVGNPPAAISYSNSIDRIFTDSEMGFQMHVLPEDANDDQLIDRLNELARADDVHGILLQSPLPRSIDVRAILSLFPVIKDVEGISPGNMGDLALNMSEYVQTSTPSAALELLEYYGIPIEGKRAVVVGRSNILGKPMALLLLQANATVEICHSHTLDLPAHTRQAELLIAAVGRPRMIKTEMVAPGAVVLDFGVNLVGGRMVGDVDFAGVVQVASAVTPVPGGTGPVSTMLLMRNTIRAAQKQARQLGTRGRIKWLPILKSPNRRK